jgi:hypothetical protein
VDIPTANWLDFLVRALAELPAAARYSAESMVVDRWAGRQP